jgi:hypothetical protein
VTGFWRGRLSVAGVCSRLPLTGKGERSSRRDSLHSVASNRPRMRRVQDGSDPGTGVVGMVVAVRGACGRRHGRERWSGKSELRGARGCQGGPGVTVRCIARPDFPVGGGPCLALPLATRMTCRTRTSRSLEGQRSMQTRVATQGAARMNASPWRQPRVGASAVVVWLRGGWFGRIMYKPSVRSRACGIQRRRDAVARDDARVGGEGDGSSCVGVHRRGRSPSTWRHRRPDPPLRGSKAADALAGWPRLERLSWALRKPTDPARSGGWQGTATQQKGY